MQHQVPRSWRTSAQFQIVYFRKIDSMSIIMNVIIVTIFLISQIKAWHVSCNGYKSHFQMEDFKFKYVFQWSSFSSIVFQRWILSFDVQMGKPSQEENDIWYIFLMQLGPISLIKLSSKIKRLVLNLQAIYFIWWFVFRFW